MTSSQNETTPVSTVLFGGVEWVHFGHHHHEYRTLALHTSDPVSSDETFELRQVGLGIDGIRNVSRPGDSTTCVLVAFRDIDISDADMVAKTNAMLRLVERQRPRVSTRSAMAIDSYVGAHEYQ